VDKLNHLVIGQKRAISSNISSDDPDKYTITVDLKYLNGSVENAMFYLRDCIIVHEPPTTSWTSWMLTKTFWFLEAMAVEPSRSVMTKHSCRRVRISSAFCSVGSLQRSRVLVKLVHAKLAYSWMRPSSVFGCDHDWEVVQTRRKQVRSRSMYMSSSLCKTHALLACQLLCSARLCRKALLNHKMGSPAGVHEAVHQSFQLLHLPPHLPPRVPPRFVPAHNPNSLNVKVCVGDPCACLVPCHPSRQSLPCVAPEAKLQCSGRCAVGRHPQIARSYQG